MAKLSPTWGKKWTFNVRNMLLTTKVFSLTRTIVPETSSSPSCQLANHTRLCGKRCNHCLCQGWKAGLLVVLPSLAGILEHRFPKRNHLAQLLSCPYVHVFLCATLWFSPTPPLMQGVLRTPNWHAPIGATPLYSTGKRPELQKKWHYKQQEKISS